MFNLNESNRIVMAQHPTDMRKGVNTLCGQVRSMGLDPADGKVYIFVGASRRVMKKLQDLLFPDGIFWDKEISGYRTEKENSALAVMRRITSLCKNNKEEKSVEISSLSRVCA